MAKRKTQERILTGSLSRSTRLAWSLTKGGANWLKNSVSNALSNQEANPQSKLEFFLSQTELVVDTLSKLKGTVMKAGQMLAVLGESYFPPEVTKLLKSLQSDSPSLPWNEMKKTIQRRLGKNIFDIFGFEEDALGSASLAQVHKAIHKETKKEYAFKIQYPGVAKSVDSDLKVVRNLFKFTKFMPNPEDFDELFDELRIVFKRELDYELEAKNLDYFRKLLSDDKFYIVPSTESEFSQKKILCMSYEEGLTLDEILALGTLDANAKNALAEKILELYFKEFFDWGIMQTDPHFGNYKFKLSMDKRRVENMILLDFGAVRNFSPEFIEAYRKFVWTTLENNESSMVEAATSLGFIKPGDSDDHISRILELAKTVMEPFFIAENTSFDFGATDIHQRLFKMGLRTANASNWRAPPREVLFLHRKLSGVFAMLFALKANIPTRNILLKFKTKKESL